MRWKSFIVCQLIKSCQRLYKIIISWSFFIRWENLFNTTLFFLLIFANCQRLPTEPAKSNSMQIHGITFADWTASGYNSDSADEALNAIAAVGATHLIIIVTAYQAVPQSNEIRSVNAITGARTPSSTSVRHAVELAQSLNMKVAIKPHVDLDNGQWRETINKVKKVFFGKLIYAASWDEAFKISFWRELDFVGIDFCFLVTSRNDPAGKFFSLKSVIAVSMARGCNLMNLTTTQHGIAEIVERGIIPV